MNYLIVTIRNNKQYNYKSVDDRPQAERIAKQCFFSGAKETRVIDNKTGECVYQIGD